MVLGDASQQLGPSLLILGCFFFLGVGLGLDMKWAWLAKSFGPTCTFLNFFYYFIDFSCFYLLNFLGQFIKILERGANYINFKAKIKILFVILLVYFFSKVGGGGRGGGDPPQPFSSSVIGYTFTIRYYIDIDYYYYICR